MFEPELSQAGQTADWSEGMEPRTALDRWPQAVMPRDARPAQERTSGTLPHEEAARHTTHAATPPQPATTPQRPTRSEEAAAPRIEWTAATRIEQPLAAVPTERITERSLETRQSIVERREVHVERALAPQPQSDSPPRPPLREARPRQEEKTPPSKQDSPRSEKSQQPPTPRAEASPPLAPRPPLRTRSIPAPAAPPPAPTIQVSIGRIELRSPQPPSAPRTSAPQRARAPKLGLDAYLRQREGGVQ